MEAGMILEEIAMRPRILILGFTSALMVSVAITGGIAAQVKSGGAKEGPPKAAAEIGGADKATAARGKPIEVARCTIELLDEVTLAFDRPGIVAFVKPREGDTVREGELLAGLKDEVAQATLAIAALEAESDVDIRYAAKAGEVAATEHKKVLEANEIRAKTFPEVEVLRLKLAAEKTVLEKESAQHRQAINKLKRNEAQAQLETFVIKAPFDGVVTLVHRSKGEAVKQGDQVLELASTDRVRVEGHVDIRDIWNVKPGAEVQVRLDIPDSEHDVEKQTFTGRLVFIDVKTEPVSEGVRIWAEVPNPNNILRAGLRAKMTIYPDRQAATGKSR
jgi:membrane fusion protein, multidrug efflux system